MKEPKRGTFCVCEGLNCKWLDEKRLRIERRSMAMLQNVTKPVLFLIIISFFFYTKDLMYLAKKCIFVRQFLYPLYIWDLSAYEGIHESNGQMF